MRRLSDAQTVYLAPHAKEVDNLTFAWIYDLTVDFGEYFELIRALLILTAHSSHSEDISLIGCAA